MIARSDTGSAPVRRCGAKLQLRLAGFLLLAGVLHPGCGKKGPPLAPLLKVPAAPEDVAARRVGGDALIQLRIPGANGDGSRPADLTRVDVYGLTGTTPTPAEMVKFGTLVQSIPVRQPPREEEEEARPRPAEGERGAPASAQPPARQAALRPPASLANGFDQGDTVTLTETLGPAQQKPVDVRRARDRQPAPSTVDPWQPDLQPRKSPDQTRFYVAVAVNHKGQRGAFSPLQPVALSPLLSVPGKPTIEYGADAVTVSWSPAPDMPRPIQPPAQEGELTAVSRALQGMAGGYNVYEVTLPAPAASAGKSVPGAPPTVTPGAPPVAPGAPAVAPAVPAPAPPAPKPAPAPPAAAPTTPPAATPPAGVSTAAQAAGTAAQAAPATSARLHAAAVAPGASSKPLNDDKPLEEPIFKDPRVEYGKERCYVVRTVAVSGAQVVESTSSPAACVTPADTFPPAAPKELAAVASEGAVSLIWEANDEADLAGYIVMRSEAGGAPQPLTPQPIKETTFRDTTAAGGVRYTYTVLAVDGSGNRSAPSNAVDETAR